MNKICHKHALVLLAIIAGGFALRLGIADRSLWEDDFFSVYWVKRGLAYILGPGFKFESNPPFYYAALFFWTKLFGFGEVALRMPSILASVATIALVYLIGRKLFSRFVALTGAALFAINPVQIAWADQVRSYGFQTFFATLCLLAIILFFERAAEKSARRRALALYAVAAATLAWTHYAQTYFVAASALTVLAACLWQKQAAMAREFLAANFAIFLATAMEIPQMLSIGTRPHLLGIRVAPSEVPGNIAIMLSGTSFPVLATFFAGVICYGGWRMWQQTDQNTRLRRLALIEIPLCYVGLLFIGNLFHPVLVARVLVVLAVPAALITAKLIEDLETKPLRAIGLATIALVYVISMKRDFHATPFRQFFAAMAAQYQPGDMVVFGPYDRIGSLAYYQPDVFARGVARWRPVESWPIMTEDYFWNETFSLPQFDTAAMKTALGQHRHIWLILLEDNRMMEDSVKSLQPSAPLFASDPLLHIYLLQGTGP